MKNFSEMLTEYMQAREITSDYKLAQVIGVSKQYVHRMRHAGAATDGFCIEIGRQINVHPALVMIARNAARDAGESGALWADLLARLPKKDAATSTVAAIKDYRKCLNSYHNQRLAA